MEERHIGPVTCVALHERNGEIFTVSTTANLVVPSKLVTNAKAVTTVCCKYEIRWHSNGSCESPLTTFKEVLGARSYFLHIYFFYVLMCVYVSRTRFPSFRAIKDIYLEIYLFLYHVFMPLNLFHFALRSFFSAFSPLGDDPYFPVPLYYIKM